MPLQRLLARVGSKRALGMATLIACSTFVTPEESYAQEGLSQARDCVIALKNAPDQKFDEKATVACDKAVAASAKNPELLRMLGAAYFRFGKPERGREILEAAVELGDIEAMTGLGLMHAAGIGGPKDYRRAAAYFRVAAEAGDAEAQSALGKLYENSHGVEKDRDTALKWYRRAAEQGDQDAMKSLRRLEQNP